MGSDGGQASAKVPGVAVVRVKDVDDPRLDDYRALKERQHRAAGGRFVAESERVVRRLLESRLEVLSVLVTAPRLRALEPALSARLGQGAFPVFLATQSVVDAIAGFHVHRGCLAIGVRPAEAQPAQAQSAQAQPAQAQPAQAQPAQAQPAQAQSADRGGAGDGDRPAERPRLLVVLEDLVDVDNVGSLVRSATAFGADALWLSPRAADPYYRKAIRTAMGSTFFLPIRRLTRWPAELIERSDAAGLRRIGAVLDPTAIPLGRYRPPPRAALLLGAEGPGLSPAARAACHDLITIPVAAGADSLNVATAGAIVLYHLTQLGDGR